MDEFEKQVQTLENVHLWFLNTDKQVKQNSAAPRIFNLFVCI